MPRAYNFKPCLLGYQGDSYTQDVDERDAFAWMLHMMDAQCKLNPNLQAMPRRKMKDKIYKNKVRESFAWDPQTKQYSTEPSEVIKKTRISDEHLKSA